MKNLVKITSLVAIGALFVGIGASAPKDVMAVSAMAESNTSVNSSINVAQALSITLNSSDLSISNLSAGTRSDSNVIQITIGSNNPYGYDFTATVGDETTYNTTDLVNSSALNGGVFTNLDSEVTSLADIASGYWGYAYSVDDDTSWSKYNGLPLWSSTGVTLKKTSAPSAASTIYFKIAASAPSDVRSGEYKNQVNFTLTAKAAPAVLYMQNVSTWGSTLSVGDTTTAVDQRDGQSYTVGRLSDNKLWLLDNLAFDGTNGAGTYIEMNDTNTDLPTGTTTTWTDAVVWSSTSENSYDSPLINTESKNCTRNFSAESCPPVDENYYRDPSQDSLAAADTWKYGAYYNYCAASGGTYCMDSSSGTSNAEYSICPAGWTMPSIDEYASAWSIGDDGYIDDADLVASLRTTFRAPLSGSFYDGAASGQGYDGGFWASTFYDASGMRGLDVYEDEANLNYDGRGLGGSVRCVAR